MIIPIEEFPMSMNDGLEFLFHKAFFKIKADILFCKVLLNADISQNFPVL